MTVRMIAVAISGIEVVITERTVITRSCAEPSFMPASTPVTSESGIIRANTQNARMPVLSSRVASSGPTAVFFSKDLPRSPGQDVADPVRRSACRRAHRGPSAASQLW